VSALIGPCTVSGTTYKKNKPLSNNKPDEDITQLHATYKARLLNVSGLVTLERSMFVLFPFHPCIESNFYTLFFNFLVGWF
jgi:hypothetical protein